MKRYEHVDFLDLNIKELYTINGGGDDPVGEYVKKATDLIGQFFGWVSTFASFKDSNTVNEGYVGRGM